MSSCCATAHEGHARATTRVSLARSAASSASTDSGRTEHGRRPPAFAWWIGAGKADAPGSPGDVSGRTRGGGGGGSRRGMEAERAIDMEAWGTSVERRRRAGLGCSNGLLDWPARMGCSNGLLDWAAVL